MSLLAFSFEYDSKAYADLIVFQQMPPTLPNIGELVLFNGPEATVLEQNKLPPKVWRVRARAFDYSQGGQERVTITLESRASKGAGENPKLFQVE